jgi:DNA-binding MarR family transcriptional regulator
MSRVTTDRRLFFLMHRANRALMAYANARTTEALGVSTAQLGTIYYVAKHPQCSLTDIADVLDLNKSAVSGMVQRLERAELVRREANPRDARGSLLSLTERGESVRVRSLAVTRSLTAEITAGFSEDEVATVARFLGTLVALGGGGDE